MIKKNIILSVLVACIVLSCTQAKKVMTAPIIVEDAVPIAFPGAEGFGKYTTGGRGGKVFVVNNLNDAGPGSFRAAAEQKEARVIIFAVSGTIHLDSKLTILGNATIAGHTAPGDGICLADYSVSIGGDNVILRYMRFRMGDKNQSQKGMVDGSGGDDALGGTGRKNLIIDHCSISWSTDEVCSVYKGDSTTLQWNLMSEPLNYSYHFETGDKDWEHHGYGGIWGGAHFSAHHNLFAHCVSRNPRFNGTRLGAKVELADFQNNVIYDWGHNNVYGGEAGNYNLVNNYFKPGPTTTKNVKNRIVNPWKDKVLPYGKWFVDGNYVEGAMDVTHNNVLGVQLNDRMEDPVKEGVLISNPHNVVKVPLESAEIAYGKVLKTVGASYKRDILDERIINDVKRGTGGNIDVQGGYPHGTAYEKTISAWPVLKSQQVLLDSDQDGMPDDWELKNKLNPYNAADAAGLNLHSFYTNVEVYINSLLNK